MGRMRLDIHQNKTLLRNRFLNFEFECTRASTQLDSYDRECVSNNSEYVYAYGTAGLHAQLLVCTMMRTVVLRRS